MLCSVVFCAAHIQEVKDELLAPCMRAHAGFSRAGLGYGFFCGLNVTETHQ